MKLQFLTMPSCHSFAEAKKIIDEIKPGFPDLEVEEIDMTTPKARKWSKNTALWLRPELLLRENYFPLVD